MSSNTFITKKTIVGAKDGALSGLYFTVKDFTAVEGLPLTYGIAPPLFEQSTQHSAIVSKLLNLGATLVGTTNLDPGALGYAGKNSHYGDITHPEDSSRSPLGSSSGAAVAVTTGACDFALCSDLVGSSRLPAAACGVWGLKLSPQLLPRDGSIFYHQIFDCFGLIASDCIQLLHIIESVSTESKECGSKIYIPSESDLSHCDRETRKVFDKQIVSLQVTTTQLSDNIFEDSYVLRDRVLPQALLETWKQYDIDPANFGETGEAISVLAKKKIDATSELQELKMRTLPILDDGFIVTPSLTNLLASPEESDLNYYMFLANLLGCPALSFPAQESPIQAIGAPLSEASLLNSPLTKSLVSN